MSEVYEIGWDEEPEETRARAMRLEGGAWVERRYSELKKGDVFYSMRDGVPIHPETQEPSGERVFCRAGADAFRNLRFMGKKGWFIPLEVVGSLGDLLPPAANSSRPGEVL